MCKDAPLEIERKYLIRYPDIPVLEQAEGYSKTDIEQTYLKNDGSPFGGRVRKRGADGKYTYTKTYKRTITAVKRVEIEEEITREEYDSLLKKADPASRAVKKQRHCCMYEGLLFELDIYPFWNDRAILEVELESEDALFFMPPFIEVIKEVTQDLRYRNRSIARLVPSDHI